MVATLLGMAQVVDVVAMTLADLRRSLADAWWVPFSVRKGPRWVRVVWRATSLLTWRPLWKVPACRRLAVRTGEFCRRHAAT